MSEKFTRRQIVSSLGVSGLGIIGLNQLSQPSLAASTDWTGNNVSQEVSNGTISDVTIPQSNLSFEVAYRGLDTNTPLSVQIEARLQTEESPDSDKFDEIGAGSISLGSADGTVTESDLSLDSYSFPLGIISNHSSIASSDFVVVDSTSKTTTVEIQVTFEQENTTETITTAFDVTLSESASFNLSNAVYTGNRFDISSESSKPIGIVFNFNGTELFMVDDNKTVYKYKLDTAYDITTASYTGNSFTLGSEVCAVKGLAFNSTGTKMFICGTYYQTIFSYELGVAYDITTANYNGNKLDVGSEDTGPYDIAFNNDGTKFFMTGISNDNVYQYELGVAYDITTANYNGNKFDYINETPSTGQKSIRFDENGTKLFMLDLSDTVYSCELETAYDITTASYTGNSLDVSSEDVDPLGLSLNSDTTRLFVVGNATESVISYSS